MMWNENERACLGSLVAVEEPNDCRSRLWPTQANCRKSRRPHEVTEPVHGWENDCADDFWSWTSHQGKSLCIQPAVFQVVNRKRGSSLASSTALSRSTKKSKRCWKLSVVTRIRLASSTYPR